MANRAHVGLCAASTLLLVASGASATDLITNGGFETGNLSGYTSTGAFVSVLGSDANPPYAPDKDSYDAVFGTQRIAGTLSQSFSDQAGAPITISFDLADPAGSSSTSFFDASFDETSLLQVTTPAAFGYTHYSFSETGTGSDIILFSARNDPNFFELDDLDVEEAVSDAPEPTTWALLIGGVALIGGMLRFQRRRTFSSVAQTTFSA